MRKLENSFINAAIKFVRRPALNVIINVTVSLMLFFAFYELQFVFHDFGLDPIFNLLLSSVFGTAAIWLILLTVCKSLIFFTDIETFLYFISGKSRTGADYTEDLTNGLTTYQRCTINQRKHFFYKLLFVFIYYLLVSVYPTANTPIF